MTGLMKQGGTQNTILTPPLPKAVQNAAQTMNSLAHSWTLALLVLLSSCLHGDELNDFCDRFITACRSYKEKNQRLPTCEADLVPKYLPVEMSVLKYQGLRLKFIFLASSKYKLFPEDTDRYVLAVLSRPVQYANKSNASVEEGRHLVTTSLYAWWVTEPKFEEILTCREEPLPHPPTQGGDNDKRVDGSEMPRQPGNPTGNPFHTKSRDQK